MSYKLYRKELVCLLFYYCLALWSGIFRRPCQVTFCFFFFLKVSLHCVRTTCIRGNHYDLLKLWGVCVPLWRLGLHRPRRNLSISSYLISHRFPSNRDTFRVVLRIRSDDITFPTRFVLWYPEHRFHLYHQFSIYANKQMFWQKKISAWEEMWYYLHYTTKRHSSSETSVQTKYCRSIIHECETVIIFSPHR